MMYYVEKFKPSHDLERFKRSSFRITGTVVRTAAQIGYSKDDIHRVVSSPADLAGVSTGNRNAPCTAQGTG